MVADGVSPVASIWVDEGTGPPKKLACRCDTSINVPQSVVLLCLLCALVHMILSFHPSMRPVISNYRTAMCFIFTSAKIFDAGARTPKLCDELMLPRPIA